MSPFFSIIIPAHNEASNIRATLESVLAQSEEDYEIIVVNDGSTDDTLKILKSFSNIQVINNQRCVGQSQARNIGIEHSRGEYLIPLDGNDRLNDSALSLFRKTLQSNPAAKLVISGFCRINNSGKVKSQIFPRLSSDPATNFEWFLRKRPPIVHGAFCLKNHCLPDLRYSSLGSFEEIALLGRVIESQQVVSVGHSTVTVQFHANRVRDDFHRMRKSAIPAAKDLFLQLACESSLKLAPIFLAQQLLELARGCYLNHHFYDAKVLYEKAISIYPQYAIKLGHSKRYLRSIWKGWRNESIASDHLESWLAEINELQVWLRQREQPPEKSTRWLRPSSHSRFAVKKVQ